MFWPLLTDAPAAILTLVLLLMDETPCASGTAIKPLAKLTAEASSTM